MQSETFKILSALQCAGLVRVLDIQILGCEDDDENKEAFCSAFNTPLCSTDIP